MTEQSNPTIALQDKEHKSYQKNLPKNIIQHLILSFNIAHIF